MTLRETIEHVDVGLDVPDIVERACSEQDLRQTLRTTTKRFPGSIHWHFKRGTARGTLEITYWAAEARLWLSCRAGRDAEWIRETMADLVRALRATLPAAGGE